MSARKTERLLNLVICLLATRRYLRVDQIRSAVPGYAEDGPGGNDTAFRRMFERDKEELRELGIPLESGTDSVWDDEPGYRIAARDYALPEITLDPQEAAALGLAARLWSSAGLADAASGALLKLRAAGIDADLAAPAGLEPRVDVTEPAFPALFAAVRAGHPVRFDYRRSAASAATPRQLEPWGVTSWHGRWYVVGHDRDRGAPRVFRLGRIVGEVRRAGPDGSVMRPEGLDLRAAVAATTTDAPGGLREARLLVRPGAAGDLRRAASSVSPAVSPAEPRAGARAEVDGGSASGAGAPGWDDVRVPFRHAERLADRVVGYGAAVVVVDPPDARDAVLRRLRAVAGAAP